MAVITWDNLFTGYDVHTDLVANHPAMFTEAVTSGMSLSLYDQFIKGLPSILEQTTAIFFASVVPLTLMAAMFFVFFMPIFKRPQRW